MAPLAEESDVIVLGGGAAGLFCAVQAAQRGLRVTVLERANKIGKKILMSGGGRCNFTNVHTSPENFLSQNPHFCKSALARYTPADFIALIEQHGIAYHEKELGQLFCDESSRQILNLLLDECSRAEGKVSIQTQCDVERLDHIDDAYVLRTSLGPLKSRNLVVATGGLSIPSLGGSDFGYRIARQFGHKILSTRAGLVPMTLSGEAMECWKALSGLSLEVETRCGDAIFKNALLLTHRGLSGPAILQISNYWNIGRSLEIDLLPGLDAFEYLQEQRRQHPDTELKTIFGKVWPKRFAQTFCEQYAENRPMKHYPDKALSGIAQALQSWPIVPSGTEGYRTAEVTLGGVDTSDVSSSSFESRKSPGLYFIGEVLDVTGWLGGYNFQWAWASAQACAIALK